MSFQGDGPVLEPVLEVGLQEVGDGDRADLARLMGYLERLPGGEVAIGVVAVAEVSPGLRRVDLCTPSPTPRSLPWA